MGVMLDSAIDCHVGGRDEYIGTKQRERARGLGMPGIRQRHAVGGWRVPACDARRRLLIVSTAGDAAGSETPVPSPSSGPKSVRQARIPGCYTLPAVCLSPNAIRRVVSSMIYCTVLHDLSSCHRP